MTPSQPLLGRRIAVTREHDDTPQFHEVIALGADVIHLPLTVQRLTDTVHDLARALSTPTFTDLVLTSAFAAHALAHALTLAHLPPSRLAATPIWAVGPGTAHALTAETGLTPTFIPASATAASLVALAAQHGVSSRHFLFPASALARRVLPEGLRALGATVTELAVYDTLPHPAATAATASALARGLDLIVLASPSAVTSLAAALDRIGHPRVAIPIAAIGPTTADFARAHHFHISVVSPIFTLSSLATHLSQNPSILTSEPPPRPDLQPES